MTVCSSSVCSLSHRATFENQLHHDAQKSKKKTGFQKRPVHGDSTAIKLLPLAPSSVSVPENEYKAYHYSPAPKRLIFRVLRANEEFKKELLPRKALRPDKEINQEANEQVLYGSSNKYIGALMSFSAELNVVLAFGGLLSRIAVADLSTLPGDRVVALDKAYLRDIELSDTLARARSRRSDEILVGTPISDFKLLDMEIVSCKRTLTPGFVDDQNLFPLESVLGNALIMNRQLLQQTSLGGPNKRMFRITVGGNKFVAHTPRPNVCLDAPILFGDDLVKLSLHEFAARSSFRVLCPDHVARGAHYLFELRYREIKGWLERPKSTFQWALTLLEDHFFPTDRLESIEPELQEAMEKLYMADVILGNWACVNKKDAAISTLCSPDEMVYACRSSNKKIVRVMVDRSLGCTYAEDLHKDFKNIVPFTPGNALDLREIIGSHLGYSRVTKSVRTSLTMDLQLHSQAKQQHLFECLDLSPWPDLAASSQQHDRQKLREIIMTRILNVLQTLPFRMLDTAKKPPARDGHVAVPIKEYMFIFGGNSACGPLKDTWRYSVKENNWLQYPDLPSPRYSHSGHAFAQRWLLAFGGCLDFGLGVVSELLVMDLDAKVPAWREVVQLENLNSRSGGPGSRCRHSSVLVPGIDGRGANIFVVAGHDLRKKLADVWQGKLDFSSPGQVAVRWTKYRDLSRPCHRHFVFLAADSSLVVLGGFGQSLMKLRVVKPCDEAGLTNSGSDIVTTSHALTFNIYEEFEHSKSFAGFAAVVDDKSNRVFLFGGGNVGEHASRGQGAMVREAVAARALASGRDRGGAFGAAPANDAPRPSRAFILSSRGNSRRGPEWAWSTFKNLADLPESHQLPLWHSWTGCLIGDEVLLFGGRGVDASFSDQLYAVRVRIDDGSREERAHLMFLGSLLNRAIMASANPKRSATAIKAVLPSLDASLVSSGKEVVLDHATNMNDQSHRTCVRILCTDEGFMNVDVRKAAELTKPDVIACASESTELLDSESRKNGVPTGICFYNYNDDLFRMTEIQRNVIKISTSEGEKQASYSTYLPSVGPRGLTVTAIKIDGLELEQISSLLEGFGPTPHLIWGYVEAKMLSTKVSTYCQADVNTSSVKFLESAVAKGYFHLNTRGESIFLASPSLAPRLRLGQHSVHSIAVDTLPSTAGFRRHALLARLEIDASKRLVGICGPTGWGETEAVEHLKSLFLKQHHSMSLTTVNLSCCTDAMDGLLEALAALCKSNVVLLIGPVRKLLVALPAMDSLFVVVSNDVERKRRFFSTSSHVSEALKGQWNRMEEQWKSEFMELKRLKVGNGDQIKFVKDEAEFEQLTQHYFAKAALGAVQTSKQH